MADKQMAMMIRLPESQLEALRQWARSEDRSVASCVRLVLRDAIPEEYLSSDRRVPEDSWPTAPTDTRPDAPVLTPTVPPADDLAWTD